MIRRAFLKAGTLTPALAIASGSVKLAGASPTLGAFDSTAANETISSREEQMRKDQEAFLLEVQRRCYQFFVDAADPRTGLISDRAATNGKWFSGHASVAACGFGLVGHAIAQANEWVSPNEAAERTLKLLRTLENIPGQHRGFYYHFVERYNGQRSPYAELSTIDTAILMAGVMSSSIAFADRQDIAESSQRLLDRVQWRWMLNPNGTMKMGWTPEYGFLPHHWDRFSELTLLVLMAIGADKHPIPGECWNAWRRDQVMYRNGRPFLSYPPLFVHQYPTAFFDFRNVRSPSGRDYFDNSVLAHEAHIDYLIELGRKYPDKFAHYGENLWGVTSSDSADGYRDWGGPYLDGVYEPDRGMDGTVVPSAAAGGLPFVPDAALRTLKYQHDTFGERVFGKFGFVNAYNPATNWVGTDVIGIDTGITMLMAENLRSGRGWDWFMQHPIAQAGIERAGFKPVS